ncbi:carbamoyl-phosphate synthase large subunit [Pelagirhabdus alkalitolerans]|uniref:Carbamoyl phosphate synthase large chain n=1 Tax=Pelagirhabdus alkalitolerans TaxID=1612202 RepID=A0A1G6JK50_9BACI|nr:carbamoyl-phosphate synthase (glutamine-hydrolyzing) large subunit [Pelagirhabdus alkalitolerans]SDC18815.1 carbamoyl-phosphate synthase large subunit [Pelagirhabdus alkalitolerans]
MPKDQAIKKVLVIGSGPIVIGQAAEFDYAGTQACLALKEEGVEVVLVNNNPATIMTDENIADAIYLEPLTLEAVTNIIKKERPDGLLPTLGGQTGLNLATELTEANVLSDYGVTLLGTPLETIQNGEDRDLFKALMKKIDEPVADSLSVESIEEAIKFANATKYPLIVRPAYTLGGAGGGIANDEEELKTIVKNGLYQSPINQVLIEQSVKGYKEVEYEVMRDANDACMIVCNMENLDPVGVHTGDSIVVAPTQTLTDSQHQMLRTSAVKVIQELGVIGGCNVQFALHPETDDYIIIEVNPRVSRSSALASKATGYPIARIAAKLALNYHLDEVLNPITGDTYASFEPSIDYVALKIPRWPFDKFYQADRTLGTQMKATGEVMALARNFPAALNKAIRSLEIGLDSIELNQTSSLTNDELEKGLVDVTDNRLFLLAEAFKRGYSVESLYKITGITHYFLNEIESMISIVRDITSKSFSVITVDEWQLLKTYSVSNSYLAKQFGVTTAEIEKHYDELGLQASYKMVDTCAAEFTADTPYFYSSWNEFDEVEAMDGKRRMVVLGSGPIRIGQGVEFDYCSVHAAMSLREQGIDSVVINNNPETVSTDYSTADHLYFEPLSEEDVLQVVKKEKADGVLVQFGGQTAINLADGLSKAGVDVIGTDLSMIEACEDRKQFYQLLNDLDIPHIPGDTVDSVEQAKETAEKIGYPVLMRPSYVIGGQGMVVVNNESELAVYLKDLMDETPHYRIFPLLIDQFITGMEVEIDAVCDGGDVIIPGIFEHVEKAGVHSGDSVAIFPSPNLTNEEKSQITLFTEKIASALNVKGMLNIQFVISQDRKTVYLLEVNPRASRTVPIASKVTGVQLIDLATRIQMGQRLKDQGWNLGLHQEIPFYAVKMPVFSANKLPGVDPILTPEMKSTGEAIGLGYTVEEALRKAFGWKNEYFLPIHEEKGLYLSLSNVNQALVDALNTLNGPIYTSKETDEQLKTYGFTQAISLNEQEKQALFDDDKVSVVADDQSNEMLTKGLKIGAVILSRLETTIAYLNALNSKHYDVERLKDYRAHMPTINQTKVEV